jgi:hypothetical protein
MYEKEVSSEISLDLKPNHQLDIFIVANISNIHHIFVCHKNVIINTSLRSYNILAPQYVICIKHRQSNF